MAKDTIQKLKDSGLKGRGGANFPTWRKWQAVKNATASQKYIICNASESEPLVFKDGYLLERYPQEVINGLKIALKTIEQSSGYLYLSKDYFARFGSALKNLIGNLPITFFAKPDGYMAGEETALLNAIEGKRPEPRIKPPYPTQVGLWGKPTLINNVETFYWVSKIAQDEYQGHRFYSIEGAAANKGVFELPETNIVKQILEKTNNWPNFDFFCQVGGGAVGEILLPQELDHPIKGMGSIIIFNKNETNVYQLMRNWAEFFQQNNCDQCAPCREGFFHLKEILEQASDNLSASHQSTLDDIFAALQKTALCPLGRLAAVPFQTALKKLL